MWLLSAVLPLLSGLCPPLDHTPPAELKRDNAAVRKQLNEAFLFAFNKVNNTSAALPHRPREQP